MINNLMLSCGIDIPFPQAQISIHQPRIKEIAFIGEDSFFLGGEMLNFSKDLLSEEDKVNLENKTNFDVLMSIMKDKRNFAMQQHRLSATMVLSLMFPNCRIIFDKNSINLIEEENSTKIHQINNNNFEEFKDIIVQIFCLKQDMGNGPVYNPGGPKAAEIAAKLKKARAKVAELKGESNKISILDRYKSILSVGLKMPYQILDEYTVYQLFEEFNRFELYQSNDIYIKAKLAGAKDMKEVDNWMKDLHS
jgi:hypothetical protein